MITQAAATGSDASTQQATDRELVANSATVAVWTLVSRLTGFVRVAVIAAVLGPTFFGNLFQSANQLPNIVFELAVGQLIASLLVPAIVRHIDFGRMKDAERVAGGFLGLVLLVFGGIGLAIAVAGPFVLRLLGAGVTDAAVRADQIRLGWPLLALVMPQLALYGCIGVSNAVQNTRQRFGLAAAAPVVENVGVVTTLLLYGVLFSNGSDLTTVQRSSVIFLGVGCTASVAVHAMLQWWGAHHAGVHIVPRAGWLDPEVRSMARLAIPSAGLALLTGYQNLVLLIVAGGVAGGVVASQLAVSFVAALVAVGARPIAVAALPTLARLHLDQRLEEFRRQYQRSGLLALFLLAPVSAILAALHASVARSVSFGAMGTEGAELVSAMLPWVALSILGEGGLLIATHASFARHDARSPLRAAGLRVVVLSVGAVFAFIATDPHVVLAIIGGAMSVSVCAAFVMLHRATASGPVRSDVREDVRETRRHLGGTLFGTIIAGVCALVLERFAASRVPARMVAPVAGVGALALYLVVQQILGAPELRELGLGAKKTRTAAHRVSKQVQRKHRPEWRRNVAQLAAVAGLSALGGAAAARLPGAIGPAAMAATAFIVGTRWPLNAKAALVVLLAAALAGGGGAGQWLVAGVVAGAAGLLGGSFLVKATAPLPLRILLADLIAVVIACLAAIANAYFHVNGGFGALTLGVGVYIGQRLLPGGRRRVTYALGAIAGAALGALAHPLGGSWAPLVLWASAGTGLSLAAWAASSTPVSAPR